MTSSAGGRRRGRVEALARELIRIPTYRPEYGELEAAERLGHYLARAGLEIEPVRPQEGRTNLLARLPGRELRPALALTGHLDTVPPGQGPWSVDPMSGLSRAGRLYGRGSADMKGALAAMAVALADLARESQPPSTDLYLLATFGEEEGCLGARRLVDEGRLPQVDGLVVGEPTGLELVVAHKGVLWADVVAEGRAAHGALPELGRNAILRLARGLLRLEASFPLPQRDALLGGVTLNVGAIQGGTARNVVADRCRAQLDVRTVPQAPPAAVLARLEEIVSAEEGLQLETRLQLPAVSTSPQARLAQLAQQVGRDLWGRELAPHGVSYFTDAAVLAGDGLPFIILGPGEAEQAHRRDEWVSLAALEEAATFYRRLARAWPGEAGGRTELRGRRPPRWPD